MQHSDTHTLDVLHPAIDVEKTASPTIDHRRRFVTYGYTVTNPGDIALSEVTVADDKCAPVASQR